MGKYDPLGERLRQVPGDQVRLSFAQIEALLGAALPRSAREKRGWWSNDETGHAAAWVGAGFEADVDLEGQAVTYRRADDPNRPEGAGRLEHARELMDTGVDQARDLIASGAGQMRDAFGKASPGVRKAAPWLVLGAGAATLVGLVLQQRLRNRP